MALPVGSFSQPKSLVPDSPAWFVHSLFILYFIVNGVVSLQYYFDRFSQLHRIRRRLGKHRSDGLRDRLYRRRQQPPDLRPAHEAGGIWRNLQFESSDRSDRHDRAQHCNDRIGL